MKNAIGASHKTKEGTLQAGAFFCWLLQTTMIYSLVSPTRLIFSCPSYFWDTL